MTADEIEKDLLARAAACPDFPGLALLTEEKLAYISTRQGIDFATALLYDRVKQSEPHRSFIECVDRLQSANSGKGFAREAMIGIVPAAFYKEKPHSGADGRVLRETATEMGFRSHLIPLRSTGTLKENSRILLQWLREHNSEKMILMSLCKGGADVKFALSAPGAQVLFGNVLAWVNICGTLSGSLVAQWLLATKPRSFAAWLLLKSGGHNLEFLREIVPSARGPLSGPLRLLPSMKLINIIGFPLRRHLTNEFMRRCHKIISSRGPNDAGLSLAEVCRLPGVIFPVWGADHYLRPDARARKIIAAVLQWLMTEAPFQAEVRNREELCGAGEIPAIGQTGQRLLV